MNKTHTLTKLFLAGFSVIALSGCVYTGAEFQPDSTIPTSLKKPALQKNAGSIQILEGNLTDRPYKKIGNISAFARSVNLLSSDPTREDINEALRAEAAKTGADAVIQVKYETERQGLASRGHMKASGLAIIYADK